MKKTLNAVLFSAVILFNLYNPVQAQDKYAGEFLAIGVGGRPLGMGGAYVALVNDVTAGYWNPALLSKINYPQFSLMHDERFGSLVNYDYGSIGIPFGSDASFGFSVIRMGIDDIADTRNALIDLNGNGVLDPGERLDPDKITRFSTTDYAFYLTYSKKQSETFSYGANLKVLRRNIADASAWGLGLDLGVAYNPVGRLFLGANIQDLTTTYISWSTGKKETLKPTAKIGSAYQFDFLNGVITPALDFDVRFDGRKSSANANLGPVSFDMHAGVEYTYRDLFSIRTGYNDIGNLTLGAGVKLPKINIDYSFAKFDGTSDLGNTHRISLTFTLEEEKFQRK
ncbi:MAG TPA: PorV/PorQ family protein [Ignavibacteria bacterium]|nr:PorV/PorQ family protein [Ignavibacteria bacterium]